MAETPYNHYALYEPDASPDLTATGEYNRAIMGIDSDMHAEETERTYADKQLSDRITTLGNQEIADVRDLNAKILAEEMNRVSADSRLATDIDNEKKARTNYDALIEREYKAADTALGKRIDNAEVEISANSADLTGIKSLTYGNKHVQFLENDNGSYSSPALDEIAEQIDALASSGAHVIDARTSTNYADMLNEANEYWPNVILITKAERATFTKGYAYRLFAVNANVAQFVSILPLPSDANEELIWGGVATDTLILNAEGMYITHDYAPLTLRMSNGSTDVRMNMVNEVLAFKDTDFNLTCKDGTVTVSVNSSSNAGITPNTQWGTIEG